MAHVHGAICALAYSSLYNNKAVPIHRGGETTPIPPTHKPTSRRDVVEVLVLDLAEKGRKRKIHTYKCNTFFSPVLWVSHD